MPPNNDLWPWEKKSYNRGQIASAEVTLYLLLHAISYHFCKVKKAYDKCL